MVSSRILANIDSPGPLGWPSRLAAIVALAVPLLSGTAQANFGGQWTASPKRAEVTFDSWGADCGRRLPGGTVEQGGGVQISQSGDHLVFEGAVRGRTDSCWTDNRNVRRVASTYQGQTWTTRCRTPSEDARAELGTYTLRAQGQDRLFYREVSQYEWVLNNSRCAARAVMTRTFSRVQAEEAPEQATPDRPTRRCVPRAPAELRLIPDGADLESGQELCLRGRVVDAAGCTVSSATVEFALAEGPGEGTLEGGCFRTGMESPDGTYRVVAKAGALEKTAELRVTKPDLSDILAQMPAEPAAEDDLAQAQGAAGVAAEAASDDGPSWGTVVLGLCICLAAVVAIVLVVRRRQPSGGGLSGDETFGDGEGTPKPMAVASARAPHGPARSCPVCQRVVPAESPTMYCPVDGALLVDGDGDGEASRSQALICPTCRRGFATGAATVCPDDGDELMAYTLFAAKHKTAEGGDGARTKICPN